MTALHTEWRDAWLLAGARTPFADLGGPLSLVSPIDLGIKAARAALAKAGIEGEAIGHVAAGSVAQASFDAYMLPRHIGLYAGVPIEVPALLVQRVCGTGIEAIIQAATAVDRQGAGFALAARAAGFFDDEIAPVVNETFARAGMQDRGIALPRKVESLAQDTHPRPSPVEALARIRPAFGGVQTGGNSSAVVDGAAAAIIASGQQAKSRAPLGRLIAGCAVGCPPEIMGIGPVPAIRELLDRVGLALGDIALVEINEAFGAQVMACARALDLDDARLNVNGGAIAIGHPLAATGVRLSVTVARALRRRGERYGIASACIGGGQGIALLLENPDA